MTSIYTVCEKWPVIVEGSKRGVFPQPLMKQGYLECARLCPCSKQRDSALMLFIYLFVCHGTERSLMSIVDEFSPLFEQVSIFGIGTIKGGTTINIED